MPLKKQIKNLLLPFACKTVLAPKSFLQPLSEVRHISCSRQDIFVMANTSNNVIRINLNGEYLYFRECKIHKQIYRYVSDLIDYYYCAICPDLNDDKIFVKNALSDKSNFSKFVGMGMTNDKTSGAYQFCMGNGGEHIGISGATPSQEERLKDLVQFIWGDLFAYTLNSGVRKGCYQTYNAVRCIAFSQIADFLNIRDMIPKTEYAMLCVDDGTSLFGTVMEEAPGICMEKMSVESREKASSPSLQRALNNLNLLDVICFEKDHRAGNYNVTFKGDKAYSVVAFDNDSPNSFGIGGISFKTYIGCSPWAIDEKVNRPYVDREMANAVLNLNEKELCRSLKDLLNVYQLFALRYRIKKVKKLLASMPDDRLITEEQWNDTTVKKELSGEYGDTYLSKFLQEQQIMVQPWIKG